MKSVQYTGFTDSRDTTPDNYALGVSRAIVVLFY